MNFVHLHCHSHYSLLDGLDSPETLAEVAADMGQPGLAITDHGVMSGHRELQRATAKRGIKPILGVEAYISPTDRFDKGANKRDSELDKAYNHIILLAKNQRGVESINTMNKIAWEEGYYYKPRIDRELLFEHSEGVIVLSGCMNGIAAKAIEHGREDIAKRFLLELQDCFGDDAYVELQPHNPYEINMPLYQIGKQIGMQSVVTGDCHYAREEDRDLEDAFLVLSTKPKQAPGEDYSTTEKLDLLDRLNVLYPDRFMSFKDIDVFLAGREHIEDGMFNSFEGEVEDPSMFEATVEICDKVEQYEYYKGLDLLPAEFSDPVTELEFKCFEALTELGLRKDDRYLERLREELRVIRSKNFASYFLIVEDAMDYCDSNGIVTGPGRGSAAGSLVCYLMGITKVDPIEHNLLFARFINEERNDFPDIDCDIQDSRRGELKEHVQEKYGHVASIATYGYFRDKGALKDAARVLGVPYKDASLAMKEVPPNDGMDYYLNYSGTGVLANFKAKYPEVGALAKRLQGRIRTSGMHAGGLVVSKKPIEHHAPVQSNKDTGSGGRIPVVSYDMEDIEEIGLIKFDFLGLAGLSEIADCVHALPEADRKRLMKGNSINWNAIDLNDAEVYEQLSDGNTVGVFQANAAPFTRLLTDMGCSNFNELVAANALVRPGAMDSVGGNYKRRKLGEESSEAIHPVMEEFTKDTYGLIIYQEQVMQAAVHLGGFTWAEADKLRKIIGKKRDVSEFDQYRDKFIDGAESKIGRKRAAEVWHDFEAHANYSFNKSHAVAYSMVTVWTMWLKINYPKEYMYSLLLNSKTKDSSTTFFLEASRLGVHLKMPHVNKSESGYTLEEDGIRIGLSAIKYLSDKVSAHVLRDAPYASMAAFNEAAGAKGSGINSRAVASLQAVGALEFEDNPLTGEESENWFEYIGVPVFDKVDLPDYAQSLITDIHDYEEIEGVYILGCRVSKVQKKKSARTGRKYTQVHVMDDTGTVALFGGDELPEEGKFYYMLVAGSNLMGFVTVADVKSALKTGQSKHALAKFLTTNIDNLIRGRGTFVVKWSPRKTKNGADMANVIVADKNRKLHDLLVFPGTFYKVKDRLKEGTSVRIAAKALDDGGRMVSDVQ